MTFDFGTADCACGENAARSAAGTHRRLRHGIQQARRRPRQSRSADGGVGYSCIAELRTIETIESGKPQTSFLRFGDRVRIEMLDAGGDSIFGAIDHVVEKY